VLSVLVVARFRFTALANDAHNIDDVQVGIGRYLAAAPAHEVIWAVDAGAVRYFGGAFVVDLLGLNNAELLGPRAQDFLDAHAPRYIEAVPAWSAVDAASGRRLTTTEFRTSTAYTATSDKVMQQHWLVLCHDPDVAGDVALRGRTFLFRCAGR
jgi:hypothetical protein